MKATVCDAYDNKFFLQVTTTDGGIEVAIHNARNNDYHFVDLDKNATIELIHILSKSLID